LPGDDAAVPRLWVAAAGQSQGWRRSAIEVSSDFGESYAAFGTATVATPMGTTLSILPPGPTDRWDAHSEVEVELLSDAMWLEGRSATSVLAGANLALVGSELLQFAVAEAVGPRRFRLAGLLRGRLGTEESISLHTTAERFVLVDRALLLPFDPTPEGLGRAYRFRAAGLAETAVEPVVVAATGRALRPLAPAHLRVETIDGDVHARWIRRSRTGYGWSDFVDSPLGEVAELYRVDIALDGRHVRTRVIATPEVWYSAADRVADGGGTVVSVAVAQVSATVGPGGITQASVRIGN
jgi:hypothetical protein